MPVARSVTARLARAFPPLRRLLEERAALQHDKQALEDAVAERNARVKKLSYRVAKLKEKVTRLETEVANLKAQGRLPAPVEMPAGLGPELLEELSALGTVAVAFERERDQVAAELDRLAPERNVLEQALETARRESQKTHSASAEIRDQGQS